jgi:hypothetical protein
MSDAGVLIDLAEKVLAIDQLEAAAPEVPEIKAEPFELDLLPVRHELYDLGFCKSFKIGKAFSDAVARSRPGHHEIHLTEGCDLAVVDIDRKLERKEVPYAWKIAKQSEQLIQSAAGVDPVVKAGTDREIDEFEMISMLAGRSECA